MQMHPVIRLAHRAYTIDMTNADDLEALIRKEQPDLIVAWNRGD